MNYLVTHPQLRKFMTEYLNDFLNHCSVSEFDSFIVIDYNYDEPDEYSIDDIAMEYDSDDGRLYIDKNFLDKFTSWFPLDMQQSKSFIKDWFEDMYNVKIKLVST
tara:strand:- start:57 stop:371 length:315 start_codon:yes stop_codon:yes gene_type:complete